jgi:methionyl-tRNA synthetase
VWFDALLNYFTGIGYGTDMEKFRKFWPCDLHLVGQGNRAFPYYYMAYYADGYW